MQRLFWSGAMVASLVLSGCKMPDGMNDACEWPAEPQAPLDPRNAADQRHLVNDVRVAEELGVRYEDSRLRRGHVSAGAPLTRDDCDARLFQTIAGRHGVTLADLRAARQHLAEFRWDPAVHLPLAGLYAFLALRLARGIRNRFSFDEKPAVIVSTVFASVVLGGLMLALGQLWDGFVEMARVGNQHLTYRALRLGWGEHSAMVFTIGVALFWMLVLLSFVAPPRHTREWGSPLRLRDGP